MKVAIIDDEKGDRVRVLKALELYAERNSCTLICDTYENSSTFFQQKKRYDLIFLDIFMDEKDGIETAREFRSQDRKCKIVFLTTSSEHRAQAFGVHAFSYLEKPASQEAIFRVMDDFFLYDPAKNDSILIQQNSQAIRILPNHILYVLTEGNYCEVVTAEEKWKFRMTFREIEQRLSARRQFLTINRGVLINMDRIREMDNRGCMMEDGCSFQFNLKKTALLRKQIIAYQFEQRTERLGG